MKPIFKEEKEFLEESLGIELPMHCWRSGMFIHLNSDVQEYIVRFRVVEGEMVLINNKIVEIKEDETVIQFNRGEPQTLPLKTWEDEYQEHEDEINKLEQESLERARDYLLDHPDHELRLSDSGGKDSLLTKHIVHRVFEKLDIDDYVVDFFNTTNETAETYKMVKRTNNKEKLVISSPQKGWYKWLKEDKNYYLPSVMSRICCSQFKENNLKTLLEKDEKYIMFLGMRKYESSKRAKYDWDLNKAMGEKSNVPDNWKRFLPIVEWTDEQVWLYMIHNELDFNPMYRLGFNRVGCLICPFQSDYIDLLIQKHYPKQWDRWKVMIKENYERYDIEKRLKWTLDEWYNGRWKQGTSKEQEIITKKMTDERVTALAELKDISEDMARKYFKRQCVKCGKKMNSDEIAMNLKVYGRNIDVLKMECKKCFCETNDIKGKEYGEMVRGFRDADCNLF